MALGVPRPGIPGIDCDEDALVQQRMWTTCADADFGNAPREGEKEDCCRGTACGGCGGHGGGVDVANVPIVNNTPKKKRKDERAGGGGVRPPFFFYDPHYFCIVLNALFIFLSSLRFFQYLPFPCLNFIFHLSILIINISILTPRNIPLLNNSIRPSPPLTLRQHLNSNNIPMHSPINILSPDN